MTTYNFLLILQENFWLFLVCIIPTVLIYVKIANNLGHSWLNPLLFNIFTAGIGIGVATFLFVTNNASTETFIYIIISSVVYWGYVLLNFPQRIKKSFISFNISKSVERQLFYVLFLLSIVATLFSYSKFGVPLFYSMDGEDVTRLDTYTNSGGFGLILRLSDFPKIYCYFYLLNLLFEKKIYWLKFILWISPFVIFGILSASRSSFFIFIFAFWGYKLFYKGQEIKLLDHKKIIYVAIIISLLTFGLQQSTNTFGAINSFLERVVACGDLYWYSLPDDTWKQLSVKNPLADVLVGLLAPMRLMSNTAADRCLGFQLTALVYNWNLSSGPVELFPIASLVYFGYYGGIIMVIIQAYLTCFFYRMFYRTSKSLILSAFFFYGFYTCVYFVGSLRDSMGQIFNLLVNAGFLWMILAAIGGLKKQRYNG